jgi:hypothetical protein
MKPLPCESFSAEPSLRRRDEGYGDRLAAERWDVTDRDEVSSYRRAASARTWAVMRTGLALLFWGLLLGLVALVVQVPILLAGDTELANVALGLLRLVAAGVMVVAVILCCTIPPESKARGWAARVLVYLGLLVGGVMLLILAVFATQRLALLRQVKMEVLVVVGVAGLVAVAFVGSLCFTLVLCAAADFWNDRALGRNFVTCFLLSWLLSFAIGLCLAAPVTWALSIGFGLVELCLLIWFLVLLYRLRQRIPTAPRVRSDDL